MEKTRRTGARATHCAALFIAIIALFFLCPLSSRAVDVDVHDEVSGSTPSYIGANEGGQMDGGQIFTLDYIAD